jgi:hypothetical protein
VINYRTSVTPTDEGEVGQKGTMVQDGFDIRRAELGVDGHLWTPNFKYYVMLITGNGTGVPVLDDAYMTYQIGDGPFIVKAGQFVDPVWHEDNVGDEYQLVADRSLVNAIIGGSELGLTRLGFDAERVEGVGVRFEQGNIHAEADLHNGYNSANTKFIDTANMPFAPKPENFGMSGRFEYKVFGDDAGWDEYKQFSALNDKEDILILGTGCEWTENGDENNFFYTFDGQYDTTWGLGAYAAVYGYNDNIPKAVVITPGTAAIAGHFLNSGFLAQGGYLIPNTQWEPYIRWDLTHLDGKLSQQQHTTNEFTLGANYYLFGQHAKVSGDVTFMPSGPPVDADSLGILADERRKEFVGRIQFQLAI